MLAAYETISDPGRRRVYDVQWVSQKSQREAKKREAEDLDTQRRKAAEATFCEEKERRAWQERLRPLEQLKNIYNSEIFELNRSIRRLSADLKRLRDQDDLDARKDKAKDSWWTYLTAPVYGKANETEEQMQQRRDEAVHRRAVKNLKEHDLSQKETKLQTVESTLRELDRRIAAEREKFKDEELKRAAKRQEKSRKEQEMKRREQEQRVRDEWAKWEATQAKRRREEATARAAKDAREAEEATKARERERAAREEAMKAGARARAAQEDLQAKEAKKAEERMQAAREKETARRKASWKRATASHNYDRPSATFNKDTCQHIGFWPKLQGSHICSSCNVSQRRFALQCPNCKLIACVNCRKTLKNSNGNRNRGFRNNGNYSHAWNDDDDYF